MNDTIAAIATPPGQGGVGIVRVSGPLSTVVAEKIFGYCPNPRKADYGNFVDTDKNLIDQGLTLYFKAPHSFTGEDVVEFQAHGGPFVLDLLLQQILKLGVKPARAGEFTERAFLNNKIDLAQAESIADLIAADSEQAVRAAVRSMHGEFSKIIHQLVEKLVQLRIYVESALDFPEEEIDFLADDAIATQLQEIRETLSNVQQTARQGSLLKEGMTVVIAGKPNAGKSSLLNQLAGSETAIVTDIPGTTRDILKEHIQIDGLPLHIIDTAGLRETDDAVESEGVKRAMLAIESADRILNVIDVNDINNKDIDDLLGDVKKLPTMTTIFNKIDNKRKSPAKIESENNTCIYLSAKTGEGLDLLRQHLKECMGYTQNSEGQFIARRRHLDAIKNTAAHLSKAHINLHELQAGELLAEELKFAQEELSLITGEFSSDDLLGRIFSDFCIGK